MTQATIYSSGNERHGLANTIDLAQKAGGLALEAITAISTGIAHEVGGLIMGHQVSLLDPQKHWTIEDGEAHSRAVGLIRSLLH